MSIEELQMKEYESFRDDFYKLIEKHKEALKLLKMGIHLNYKIDCVHYKNEEYAISPTGSINPKTVYEWHD